MATSGIEQPPKLAPAVAARLGELRERIRWYVWLEGLTGAVAWLGAAFWVSLAIDWFFEPPPPVRGLMLVVIALGLAVVLLRLIGRRAFVRLTDGNMATVLERRFPQLGDSLLTAVALTDHPPEQFECNPRMLAHTCREAARRIGDVRLGEVFNPLPLRRSIAAAVLLTATIVAYGVTFPVQSNIWARRVLLLDNELLWPRNSRLEVEGFTDGVAKVARGADLKIVAKADTDKPVIPRSVQVRFRSAGRRNKTMSREGAADPARDQFQFYSCVLEGILTPVRFDVVGGDARVRDLRIEVVDSPTVAEMTLDCKYPQYTSRAPRSLPVAGVMEIPLGTEVSVMARANKDLVRVQVDASSGEQVLPPVEFDPGKRSDDPRRFAHVIPSLDEDTTLLFTLSDTDGITAREPVRLSLVTVADAPPQLSVQLDGIGQAVTPTAMLPAVGRIGDDWGIAEVWFETAIDEQPAANRAIGPPPPKSTEWNLDEIMQLDELGLAPGQKLVVSVKASDHFDLAAGPNVGSSERWLLDVVTPEQLKAMLEARELVLRQRFEAIIEEVTETRDLLIRLDFATPDANDTKARGNVEAPAAGSEPGDEPGDDPDDRMPDSPMRQLALRTLRVDRALTNSRKSTHETRGIADAFDDIRRQLINNRIDTEELKIRLSEGIVAPLGKITEEMFPELESRLARLRKQLDDEQLAPQRAEAARRQADDLLVAMRKVLDRMIELEDFNEAIELLRTIIKLQEELDEQTRQRHKQKLRELLED